MCKWRTYKHLVINGRIRDIDSCIYDFVKMLNDNGFTTKACCCGHGNIPANIVLSDGREIIISPDFETSRKIYQSLEISDEKK